MPLFLPSFNSSEESIVTLIKYSIIDIFVAKKYKDTSISEFDTQ